VVLKKREREILGCDGSEAEEEGGIQRNVTLYYQRADQKGKNGEGGRDVCRVEGKKKRGGKKGKAGPSERTAAMEREMAILKLRNWGQSRPSVVYHKY